MLSRSITDNHLHEDIPFSTFSSWVDKNVLDFFRKEKSSVKSENVLQPKKTTVKAKDFSFISEQLSSDPIEAAVIVPPLFERKNSPPIDIPGAKLRKSQEVESDEESERSEDLPASVGVFEEKKSSQKIMDTFNWWRQGKVEDSVCDLMADDAVEPVVIKSFGGSYQRPF